MELPNNIYLDYLIKKNIFSYLPITKFTKGVYTSPMLFYDNEKYKHIEETYQINILKITNKYLFLKITFNEDFEDLFLKKKKKTDKEGEYIEFNKKDDELILYETTRFFFKSSNKFRTSYLKPIYE
jgi:hypothetical protein